jgi:hypothetical protein
MRKLTSYFLFCIVAVSCREVPGEKSEKRKNHLKMIFSELLDSSATICIQKNRFVVFTEFKNHVELRSDTGGICYVRYFTAYADTLTEDSIQQVNKDEGFEANSPGDTSPNAILSNDQIIDQVSRTIISGVMQQKILLGEK